MERKSRRRWQYLFCFAESDFTPRQGHQHSAFVTAELQQASPVCRAVVGETVGALLGSAGGEVCGRLKSFHPLLALPCGHVRTAERRGKEGYVMHVGKNVEKTESERRDIQETPGEGRADRPETSSCVGVHSCMAFTDSVDA